MNVNGNPARPRRSRGFTWAAWGFLCGGIITLAAWRFSVSPLVTWSDTVYDFSRFAWAVLTGPAGMLAGLCLWRQLPYNAEDLTAGMLAFTVCANAILGALLAGVIGWSTQERRPVAGGSRSRWIRWSNVRAAMILGFVIGAVSTATIYAGSKLGFSEGWTLAFLELMACAPSKLLTKPFAVEWPGLGLGEVALPLACLAIATNGLLAALILSLGAWLADGFSTKRG